MPWPAIAPSLQPRGEIDVATFEDYAHVLAEGGTHFPDLGVKPAGGAEAEAEALKAVFDHGGGGDALDGI